MADKATPISARFLLKVVWYCVGRTTANQRSTVNRIVRYMDTTPK